MRKNLLVVSLMLFIAFFTSAQQNALLSNGRLKLVGNQLSNQCGDPVQLRGLSTHAPMSHQNCYTSSSVASMANDWGADVYRLAMYSANPGISKGYVEGDQEFWDGWMDDQVEDAEKYGMYCIIDWHILKDKNPFDNISTARDFFQKASSRYKDKRNVIYEICNEPNGSTSWNTVKNYAEQIIPIIRANDPEGIILVGSPTWSSRPDQAANNPLTGSNAYNVMYTFHFYANTHFWHDRIKNVASRIPLFCSEWGTVDASGNGGFNPGNSNTWVDIMNGNNTGGQLISHCNWAYTDKNESASLLREGACDRQEWTERTSQTGNYIYDLLSSGDNFTVCQSAGDEDGDGVINGDDDCANTPLGTFVDENGCPALQNDTDNDGVVDAEDICPNTPSRVNVNKNGCPIANEFESNVCQGFNNFQNYVRTDFSNLEVENLFFWNKKGVEQSDVYEAEVVNEELLIKCTRADPNYAAQGFSFGQDSNGDDVTADISAFKKLILDVRFDPIGNYSRTDILFGLQIEDADGNVINGDRLANDLRVQVVKNQWRRGLEFDFTDGVNIVWIDGVKTTTDVFDFTRVTKIIMFCNPGAGESWSRPEFTGNWKIDNFSFGYDEDDDKPCDAIRDEDNDGVRIEDDSCRNTIQGIGVDATGCAAYQLDNDNDGVANSDDQCPNTAPGLVVNSNGCDETEADEDNDGVLDKNDLCPLTPLDIMVNEEGCDILTSLNSSSTSGLRLFPNPVGTVLNLQGLEESWKLSNSRGEIISNGSSKTIDFSGLENGLYFIQSGQNSFKIIKE